MPEHILFLTGKLAERQLCRVIEQMQPDFDWTVHQLGLSVAGLMTADMIRRRLKDTLGADRILVPGRCRGDLESLSQDLGLPVERGPEELKDLPLFFGKEAHPVDLSRYDIRIFAEITDAPRLEVPQILARAAYYRGEGADVIDLGCLPGTPFDHLEDAIAALKEQGFVVSVDSLETDFLRRAGLAGADYLLSLHEETLWLVDEVPATPILIPQPPTDMDGLYRCIETMAAKGRPFLADPILEPIHFGFTESLVRYHRLRRDHPDAEIMMGVGNLTELTHADTIGINTLLLGICSELHIRAILTTEVSQHCRRAVREAALARRILHAARDEQMLPKHLDDGLMPLHEPSPFPYSAEEIAETAAQVRDPSFRIQISRDGIHVYNRDGLRTATDPFAFFPQLGVENDAAHAFYLGAELARAEIAWHLGKRYSQDEPLHWGCGADTEPSKTDLHAYKEAGTTLQKKLHDAE